MKVEHRLTSEQKKEAWGEGPWVNEPDYVEFEHNGAQCLIRRVYWIEGIDKDFLFGGHLCGYVLLPENHPWRDKGFDIDASPHFGITFNGKINADSEKHYVGFDCGHCYDIMPCMLKFNEDFYKDPRITGHITYKDIDFVINECKKLAEEMLAATV